MAVSQSPEAIAEAIGPGPAPRTVIEALEKEALDAVSQLIQTLPRSSDPLALMGEVHVRFGKIGEGMQWWQRCLKMDPRRLDVYQEMAEIAWQSGEFDRAAQLWGKVLEMSPAAQGVRNNLARALIDSGQMRGAVAILNEEIKTTPRQRGLSYDLMGKAHLQLREYEKAQQYYKTATEITPDVASAWYGLATALARLGQSELARQCMHKFQTLKASDRDAETGRKRSTQDLTWVRSLVAQTHTEVGMILRHKGYLRRAGQHWLRAAELNPLDRMCRVQLALMYRNEGKPEKALPICEQLVRLDSANAVFHLNLGIIYAQLNRIDSALAEVQRAVELDPDNVEYQGILQRMRERN